MSRVVRWGILGVAKIINRLLPAFKSAKNAELHAIASRTPGRAQEAALTHGIPTAHGSYEALIDDPDIDAIYNPLPNTLHDLWTRRAAEHGKHVLCEKPLCPTAAEARALVDFCRTRGVTLLDGFMWPHHPRTGILRHLLDAGTIGPVCRVTGSFTFAMNPLDPNNIRLKKDLAGGSLLDVGCYPVYGIRWAMGADPVRVFAWSRQRFDVDVELNGQLWFADGRMASFDCGFTLPLRQSLEITGTEGVVRVPEMWLPGQNAHWTVQKNGGLVEEFAVAGEDQIRHMVENFSQAVLDGTPLHPEPEEAVQTLRVLDALAMSAREGKIVEVE